MNFIPSCSTRRSPRWQLTREILQRISSTDSKLHCYLTVDEPGALAQARAAEQRLAAGHATPLTGVPLAIKDVIITRGLRTTCASKYLENYPAAVRCHGHAKNCVRPAP